MSLQLEDVLVLNNTVLSQLKREASLLAKKSNASRKDRNDREERGREADRMGLASHLPGTGDGRQPRQNSRAEGQLR